MLKSLRQRLERLESAGNKDVIEVLRERTDGTASLTIIRRGRVIERRELTADEVRRWPSRQQVTIERSYVNHAP